MNNNDLSSMHESDIRKNFINLDTLISNIKFSDESNKINLLSQADKLIKDTETKIKNYQISTDYSDTSKIKEFQKKLQSYKKKINTVSKDNSNYKSSNNNYYNRDDDTQNLTSNSFNKIQLATRNTIEMESMTGDILGDLNNQSEKMKGVKSKLGVMDTDLNSSNSLLGNIIGKQSDDMKVIIIVGCILSFIIICFLMYKIIRLFL
jgi:hypothetical protein